VAEKAEKKRLFKLAEEIKREAHDIIAYLKSIGVEGVTAASYLDAERVQEIKEHFSTRKTKAKKAAKAEAKAEVAAEGEVSAHRAKAAEEKAGEAAMVPEQPKVEAEPPKVEAVPLKEEVRKEEVKKEKVEEPPKPTLAPTVPAAPVVVPAVSTVKPAEKVAEKPKEAAITPPSAVAPPPPHPRPPVLPLPHRIVSPAPPHRVAHLQAPPLPPAVARPAAPQGGTSPHPPLRGKKPAGVGTAPPTQTIRQHISSKFGEIRPRPLPPRAAEGSRPGVSPGRFASPLGFPPAPSKPQAVPSRDHRPPARTRANYRQHPEEGKEARLRTGGGRLLAPTIAKPAVFQPLPITKKITLTEGVSVKELSEKLEIKAKDIIKRLLDKGIFATLNQALDEGLAKDISRDFGAEAEIASYEEVAEYEAIAEEKPENLVLRPPVVTIMGHVDHGKTSLLDAIRETNVTSQEAGGITQHIGAYQVVKNGRVISFLDTPGHEAFTMMRARGAKVTDLVVLVVAADDGVMPQTLEAIAHARAAKVPILVAINKIDKPNAQVDRVKKTLSENGLVPEDWAGDTVTVEVSAKQKINLELLLEMILLVSDLQGLKANPQRSAMGTILEAKLDKGRGPVATVLVQNGTLLVGDSFIVGAVTGKVRAMFDYLGRPAKTATPSTPVEVLGLAAVPQAGDLFQVMTDVSRVKQIGSLRQLRLRESQLAKTSRLTLEHLHEQLKAGAVKELPIILKADVQGSVEVLADTLTKLSTEKVKVKIIHRATGAITETDVLLASASNAIIVGFNVRPERKAAELAEQEGVDIRLHTIIYNVTSEIRNAMVGMLDQAFKESYQGTAQVRTTFRVPKVGVVAGCYISDGKVTRNAQVRLLRDNVVVYEGRITSLKRFKDDASEVRLGFECGIGLENFNDIKNDDVIEAFIMEKVEAQLV
jgi:translation initiation factor IF-2